MCNAYKLKTHEVSDGKASQLGEYLPSYLKMDEGEHVVGMTVTTDFHGYMLFCFENGKMTKTPVKNYETKLNRKKLAKAFSAASPLVKLIFLEEDIELVAVSTVGKALAFNTSAVPVKTTRDSQGVAVMTLKKAAHLKDVLTPEQFGAEDLKYYKTKNIPAVGCFIKESQTSMF